MTVRTAILPLAAVALVAGPLPALAKKSGDAAPVQLLQPGDSAMTCQALATEINALALAEAKPRKKKGLGLGGLGRMLSMASPMLGGLGGGGLGGQLATQAIGMAQQSAMEAQAQGQMDAAMDAAVPAQSVEAQRKNRLMGFFQAKGC